jgi:hypothetical protein
MRKDLLKEFPGVNANFKIQLIESPARGVIIDDFFIQPYYQYLSKYFNYFLSKKTEGDLYNINYILEDKDLDDKNNPFNFFKLPLWKYFVSKVFDIDINKYL